MRKFFGAVSKELLILSRDRGGILVLFVMPAVLVLAFTLVQENVLNTRVDVLLIDHDDAEVGSLLRRILEETPSINLLTEFNRKNLDEETAKKLVRAGKYKFMVIVPENTTNRIKERVRQNVMGAGGQNSSGEKSKDKNSIVVYYDPVIQGIYRAAVVNALYRVVSGVENAIRMEVFIDLLPMIMGGRSQQRGGVDIAAFFDNKLAEMKENIGSNTLITIEEKFALEKDYRQVPTTVQQNVPAWSLFGIFFIVVPLAGTLIRERQNATLFRLMSMPVSFFTLILGKVIAYLVVCIVQLVLIGLIGIYLLPLLGAPRLEIGASFAGVIYIGISSALAATGFGILVGTLARTYEQGSMFGAISVVIGALIGGIMVPVYAMPQQMQRISVLSPLNWGLEGFIELFARGGDLTTVYPYGLMLLAFFAVSLMVSLICYFFASGFST